MDNKILRFVFVVLGSVIVGFGISIFLNVGQGLDSWTLLLTGILNVFNDFIGIHFSYELTFGLLNQLFGVFAVFLGWIVEKKNPKLATILNFLIVGFVVDFLMSRINFQFSNIFADVIIVIVATIITGFGVGIYITAKMGEGPVDIIMMIVINLTKTHSTLGRTRMIVDASVTIIGVLLGGNFGWATIIAVFGMGYSVQFMMKTMNKYVWLEKTVSTSYQ